MNTMLRTVKVKMDVNPSLFTHTIRSYNTSWNLICQVGFKDFDSNAISLHNKCYQDTRAYLPSALAISVRQNAVGALKPAIKKLKKNQKVSCPERTAQSYTLDKNSAWVKLNQNTFSVLTTEGRVTGTFQHNPVLEQHTDWELKRSFVVSVEPSGVFLTLFFEKSIVLKTTSPHVLGVDRGLKHVAVTSDNTFHSSKQIHLVVTKRQKLRSALQAKGTKSAKRHLKKLSKKEQRFRRNHNHIISKQIVSSVSEGSTIVLEDLSGIRARGNNWRKQQRSWLNSWAFFQLEEMIRYKAEARNISVELVDARYTSQKCSACGITEKSNRKGSSYVCVCGANIHADLNAARNIRNNYVASQALATRAVVNQPIVAGPTGLVTNQRL